MRIRILDPKLARLCAALGLIVGIALCPVFGKSWRSPAEASEALHRQPSEQVGPGGLLQYLFTGRLPEDRNLDVPLYVDDGTAVASPGALNIAYSEEDQGEAVQTLDGNISVYYTINLELQQRLEKLLAGYDNPLTAIVALEPSTGRILAMAEKSTIDVGDARVALKADAPAASVFKIVTAAALLESGKVSPYDKVCFSGGRSTILPGHLEFNPKRDTNCQDLGEALARSSNVVLGRLAYQNLSYQDLQQAAENFGFNKPIPFLWNVEPSGAEIPTSDLEFARSAAGFNHTKLSPLHAALLIASVANGGVMMNPYLVSRVEKDGQLLHYTQPTVLQQTCTPETAGTLLALLSGTTKYGTAGKYFRKGLPLSMAGMEIAAKTGSLSAPMAGSKFKFTWFVAAAPLEDPQVAIAVLAVNEQSWKVKAGSLGRKALEEFFSLPVR